MKFETSSKYNIDITEVNGIKPVPTVYQHTNFTTVFNESNIIT